MLNQTLSKLIFKNPNKKATRDGFGDGILEAAQKDDRIVALCADLTDSTRLSTFKKLYPKRFVECGVAEQGMITIASGMANYGKIPFVSSYSVFSPGRNWEQIRTTVCINDVPVKIAGHHGGVLTGADGATHQALEDIALMRCLPNMIVINPCDYFEAKKATISSAFNKKPTFIRFYRNKTPIMTTPKTKFEIGKALYFWRGKNPKVTIVGSGYVVYDCLLAAIELEKRGIGSEVINLHTIKPIDKNTLIESVKKTKAVVVVEDHQIYGGVGGAVSEVLGNNYPVFIEFVGIKDIYGESGNPDDLLEKYGISSKHIFLACKKVIKKTLER